MTIRINRTGRTLKLPMAIGFHTCCAMMLAEEYGFHRVNPLDIAEYRTIQLYGTEINNLIEKDGVLYCFKEWFGEYPYDGIIIEEIGSITNDVA